MLRPEDVSRTARLVAACRALDAAAGRGRIVAAADQHAAELAGADALARAAALPALVAGVALRTRWLDERIAAFVAEHRAESPEIVLVGAGLDTRALRLGLDGARFLEVDLPGMLELKRERLGDQPSVQRLPADLRSERLARVLSAHPARRAGAPTCVVWEGVSYYLPPAAVHAALEDFAAVVGARGLLLFDFVTSRWLAAARRVDPEVLSQIARWGEPMIFGFDDVGAALAAHRLQLVEEIGTEELLPGYGLQPATARWYAGRMAAARRAVQP